MKNKIKIGIIVGLFLLVLMVSGIMETENDLDPTLVALWHMDEGFGNFIFDATLNGNDGIIYGATWTDGICRNALKLDGVDDRVEFFTDIFLGSSDATVIALFFGHPNGISSILGNDGYNFIFWISDQSPEHYAIWSTDTTINEAYIHPVNKSEVNENDWNFVALVKEGGDVTYYLNGIKYDNTQYTQDRPFGDLSSMRYIGYSGNMHAYYQGIIDNVAIYNRALTQEEIQQLYQNGMGCGVIPVIIDIKPGSYPNSINSGSEGNVPVAIFSTTDFDATTVNPLTVTLAGASVKLKGKGMPMASFEDINDDGILDIVVHVSTEALQLTGTDTEAVLKGETFDGVFIRGVDTIRIVKE